MTASGPVFSLIPNMQVFDLSDRAPVSRGGNALTYEETRVRDTVGQAVTRWLSNGPDARLIEFLNGRLSAERLAQVVTTDILAAEPDLAVIAGYHWWLEFQLISPGAVPELHTIVTPVLLEQQDAPA